MTPLRLILFRLLLLLIGPFAWGSKLVRRLLLLLVMQKGRIRYVAHADFLDVRELTPNGEVQALTDIDPAGEKNA